MSEYLCIYEAINKSSVNNPRLNNCDIKWRHGIIRLNLIYKKLLLFVMRCFLRHEDVIIKSVLFRFICENVNSPNFVSYFKKLCVDYKQNQLELFYDERTWVYHLDLFNFLMGKSIKTHLKRMTFFTALGKTEFG